MVAIGVIATNVVVVVLVQTRQRLRAAVSQTIADEVDREEPLATVRTADEKKKLLVAVDERNAPEMVGGMNVTETVTAEVETGKTNGMARKEKGKGEEIDATEMAAGLIEIEMVDAAGPKKNPSVVMSASRMSSGKIKRRRRRQMDPPLQLLSATVAETRIHKNRVKARLRNEKIPLLIKIPRKMAVPVWKMSRRKRKPRKPEMLNRKKIQVC